SLQFSEQVDRGAGSPAIRVVDEGGYDVGAGLATVTGDDGRRVEATMPAVAPGTYTVIWSARSAIDGHTLAGSYAFRVGGGRAPGAATVAGERPAGWAVVTRWLTFLGAALIVGGFLVASMIIPGTMALGRMPILAMAGCILGLIASLGDIVLPVMRPPAEMIAPSMMEAMQGLPDAFWARVVALAASLILVVAWSLTPRVGSRLPALEWFGLALGLVVLLGLSMTSHAAARTDAWRLPALASNILHQWSVALWAGGLAHIGLIALPAWRATGATATADARPAADGMIRRFSPLALGLVIVAVLTGVLNAGLALPVVRTLWESTYGRVILIKVIVLLPALALATFHRTTLRRHLAGAAYALRLTLRAETALVLLVVLGGSVLAMLAPPAADVAGAEAITLVMPVETSNERTNLVRLQAAPLEPGVNRFAVTMVGPDGLSIPLSPGDLVRIDAVSLEEEGIAQAPVEASWDGEGGFVAETNALSIDGWWRIGVLIRQAGQPDMRATFVLLLPDPNLQGVAAVELPESDPLAQEIYEHAVDTLADAESVRYHQVLGGGTGLAYVADYAISAGTDGDPAAVKISSSAMMVIKIGEREWLRSGDAPWRERTGTAAIGPAVLAEQYEGAAHFHLGRMDTIDSRSAQVISFFVDNERYVPAWYAWWVDIETGALLQEAMVSRSHYMLNTFRGYDADVRIEPPEIGGTPVAVRPDLPRH
ncbi:MAG TPA: CopD family protein, partial [Thermomicrobiales bacterium]|nr:CopD family protein [Thermomicrobiales bacterium]